MAHAGGRPRKYATEVEKRAAHRKQKAAYKRRQAMQKQSAKDANKKAPEPAPVAPEKQPPVAPVHPRAPTLSTHESRTPVFPQGTEAAKTPHGHPQRPVELGLGGGVVDAKLKVHRVGKLRVVDASVFPMIPTTHISCTVYAVAEKAADLIKRG